MPEFRYKQTFELAQPHDFVYLAEDQAKLQRAAMIFASEACDFEIVRPELAIVVRRPNGVIPAV